MAHVAYSEDDDTRASYVSWSAIFAGAILATAYSFVMLTFGAAAGLSLVSPFSAADGANMGVLIAVSLWLIWVQVSGFALGGYIAGRIRARSPIATEHEVEVRDGVHGLLVWATGALLGFLLATSLTGSIIGMSGQAASSLFGTSDDRQGIISTLGAEALSDSLLRSDNAAQRAGADIRDETARLVSPAVSGGTLEQSDRDYLVQLVASQTGLSQADAQVRVDEILQSATEAAEQARRAAIIIGFVLTASFLISAAAAWWAAGVGGDHRDAGTDFSRFMHYPARRGAVVSGANDLKRAKPSGSRSKQNFTK
jgi:hypothetical protein